MSKQFLFLSKIMTLTLNFFVSNNLSSKISLLPLNMCLDSLRRWFKTFWHILGNIISNILFNHHFTSFAPPQCVHRFNFKWFKNLFSNTFRNTRESMHTSLKSHFRHSLPLNMCYGLFTKMENKEKLLAIYGRERATITFKTTFLFKSHFLPRS